MNISSCGLICDECEFFGKTCDGCKAVKGQTFWAKEMMPTKTCPLFDCAVNQRKYSDCGDCKELPCELFLKMKDPNSTEEEHQESLKKRVAILKGAN
jgi:hypothetical protein